MKDTRPQHTHRHRENETLTGGLTLTTHQEKAINRSHKVEDSKKHRELWIGSGLP